MYADFELVIPETLDEALAALAEGNGGCQAQASFRALVAASDPSIRFPFSDIASPHPCAVEKRVRPAPLVSAWLEPGWNRP